MTELKTDRDLVELLRQRVPEADCIDAARELWALLHNGRLPGGHQDAESARYYRNVVELFLASPAAQAVARALLGTEELAAQADEQARPVVQRILDGELGQEAALAMTRVILDLTHARGEVKALEREAQIARPPWQVVDTGGGEPNA